MHHNAPVVPADLSRLLDDDGPTGADLIDLLGLSPDDVDVVIGGPPCQGFSESSNRDPDDPINDLVWTYFDVVAAARPDAFVMENVPGLRKHKDGDTLTELIDCAEGLGFNTDYRELDASNYGVPQNRDRLFIIGVRDGQPKYPEPLDDAPNSVLGAIGGLSVEPLPDADQTDHSDETVDNISKLDFGDSFHGEGRQVRLYPDQPDNTVTASNRHIHPLKNRELTIRECAVLQSFPATYEFLGNREERTRQVGNAVPPRLAEAIGRSLRESLGYSRQYPTKCVRMSMQALASLSGRLTEREVESILLRSGGLSWREVGDEMGIKSKTASKLKYRAESKVEEAEKTIEAFERLTQTDE